MYGAGTLVVSDEEMLCVALRDDLPSTVVTDLL